MLGKAHQIMVKISGPLANLLPDRLMGLDGSMILAVILLVFLCFFAGLLIRSKRVKKQMGRLEDTLFVYIPGYLLLKSIAADTVGESEATALKPVVVKDGDAWKIGFLVEEKEGLSTVFIADAPRHDAGEVLIFPSELVKRINVPNNKVIQSLKNYGKGAIDWVNQ
ncbi:MAG: hypothetical protein CFE25_10780 [Chitinophagaceae bacterium BSSC1]|nr:MAG: hypothetical protein CFE25_10780 [Chitinophagaceae bacterium BSSC1]